MTGSRWRLRWAAVLAVCALAPAGVGAETASAPEDALARARALAAANRCEEALPVLERARAEALHAGEAVLLGVQCLIQLRRYEEALARLDALPEGDQDGPDAELYTGIANYHLGRRAEARQALERAEKAGSKRAETQFYLGLLALDRKDHQEAIERFARARAIDPTGVGPLASYYSGMAHVQQRDFTHAREDLARVLELDSGGTWGDQARSLLHRVRTEGSGRRWRLDLTLGFESDDNVVLRGDGMDLPEEISDQGDERAMWRTKGSSDLAKGDFGTFGVTGDYQGTLHRHLGQFDLQFPAMTLWWNRPLGSRTLARVETQVGHAWIDRRPFVMTYSLGSSLVHDWSAGRTSARVRVFGYDYRDAPDDIPDGTGRPGDPCPGGLLVCGTPGVNESKTRDRTGVGYELLAQHGWSSDWGTPSLELRPALRFQHYLARGDESSYLRLETRLGVRVGLPFAFVANTLVSYAYRPYRAASSLPDPRTLVAGEQFEPVGRKRRDHVVLATAELEHALFGSVVAAVRYTYLDNHSNLAVADYHRQIIGAYLSLGLGN